MYNGGPAFPLHRRIYDAENKKFLDSDGLTMRDWFAGMALTAAMQNMGYSDNKVLSKMAYMIADAMLKEREM
jgi:hypothetical protein